MFEALGLRSQLEAEDGTVVVPFTNMAFICQINDGGIFSVHGLWRGDLSEPADLAEISNLVQHHNATALMPKVYISANPEGAPQLHTEANTIVMAGMTDDQLSEYLQASLSLSMRVATVLEEALPHLVTWQDELPDVSDQDETEKDA
ncbi:hypothetical protein BK816_00525 [Boudabousia tangfeifanii]|uniref:Sensory transduction regulator n=2 Tax=Boudabousia tangfeifanii TaxID=1912795 RepID=A0A1D9MI17_9ACTO|nr:hypothetical protein BK816_00525 [Boudabousia tangfeifanii]